MELIPGTGVYVTLLQLEEARREAKSGTRLARKLMDAFWDQETLARSTVSSKGKYQQLDPNVIRAIEGLLMPLSLRTTASNCVSSFAQFTPPFVLRM